MAHSFLYVLPPTERSIVYVVLIVGDQQHEP